MQTRTRSKSLAEDLTIEENDSQYDVKENDPAPSQAITFKSRLQRFEYASTSTVPNTSTPPPCLSPRIKRPLSETSHGHPPTASPSKKRKRQTSHYAPPSKYAHLPPLLDILQPGLICVFVGTNPGIRTATAGHAYAHPSNLFWKLLHASGCTDVRLRPEEDGELPRWYAMGNTNIVERPSRDAGELSKREMAEGTPGLEEKVRRYRPEAVCIVGKGIWEAVWRWRYKREMRKEEFRWGWQGEKDRMGQGKEEGQDDAGGWHGVRVYVTSSTSGLSASLKPAEKEAIWKPFGEWVKTRRKELHGTEGRISE